MMSVYTLTASDGRTQADIHPELGALCSSFRVPYSNAPHGLLDLLYRPENFEALAPSKICGGLPFHFPACGRTAQGFYQAKGQRYPMPIHGFSAQENWQVVSLSQHQILLKLTDTSATHPYFPFQFELRLGYEVHPHQLKIFITIVNHDSQVMPFSMGFHPYFSVPLSEKPNTHICFQALRSIAYTASLSDLAGDRPLQSPMPASLTAEGLNERLSVLGTDTHVSLSLPDYCLLLETGGDPSNPFQYLQLYHDPKEPFFCIEPWAGTPNSLNHPERLLHLEPGKSLSGWLTVACQASA